MPRTANPHVPYTPNEIGVEAAEACEAGASIVHFHARNSDGTRHEAIRAIRARCECLVFPTWARYPTQQTRWRGSST
ncbi:3-keto-5-aminohexanoate cleavage protein [Bradyrhizobium sp. CCGB20]|uniref:3-keto-5-aminohexanoate cleavage protein n=1 Tax=Bradyrhizobium sp. CCGB20 TaxID=2949633 RepID=UPI0020B45834|nr:3-keto-5-aminohexanoate cleavage protein [Bradyrhizobium sp. CCGB20]MCP3397188.1 3-keto-5-aminohexanoate cleavage protein [Bradyrhizobium sp. CCGB20]